MLADISHRRGAGYGAAILGVAVVTAIFAPLHSALNTTTVALAYLLVVLFVATGWGRRPAMVAAVLAMLCFNFFFLPPIYTFTIADPQNWVALTAFLVTAFTAGQLSERAKRRAAEAEAGRAASAYNRSLIEANLDPLVTIGFDGRIIDVNSATETVTGHSRDELIGTDFSALFHRAGPGPVRLPAGVARRLRARPCPGAPAPRWTQHVGALQRVRVSRRSRTRHRGGRGRPPHPHVRRTGRAREVRTPMWPEA